MVFLGAMKMDTFQFRSITNIVAEGYLVNLTNERSKNRSVSELLSL